MGGYGSGNHRLARRTVEAALHIPIGWMIRQCPITVGFWRRSMSWTCRGESRGSTGFVVERDQEKPISVRIECTRDGMPFKQVFELTYLKMPNGGIKTYAVCPYCSSRCSTMYFSRLALVSCRQCANLTYESSQSSYWPSGQLGLLVALLHEEVRWERKEESRDKAKKRCSEWRVRKKGRCNLWARWNL